MSSNETRKGWFGEMGVENNAAPIYFHQRIGIDQGEQPILESVLSENTDHQTAHSKFMKDAFISQQQQCLQKTLSPQVLYKMKLTDNYKFCLYVEAELKKFITSKK